MKVSFALPTSAGLAITLALSVSACGQDTSKPDKPEESAAEATPVPEKKDVATLVVGDKPTLPEVFKGLELGMTGEAAKKIFPAMPEEGGIEAPAYDSMIYVHFNDAGELASASFSLPKDKAESLLTSAWGDPVKATDLGQTKLYWFNTDDGIRATLSEYMGDMKVEFSAYVPFTDFVGAEGTAIAFEKTPILGATVEQLRERYPEVLVETSQAEAEKDRKELGKFMGKDKGKLAALGKAKASVHLSFLPTEWGSYWTRVHPYFGKSETVQHYWFDLAYKRHPEAKTTIFDLFKAKYGEPKEVKVIGGTAFLFQKKPRITLEDNTITGSWKVKVGGKR